jgi:hypothetical protein
MAIPAQQIGWSQKAKLLWNISKQLENLTKVAGNVYVGCTPAPASDWITVTGGAAGDGTVAQFSETGFNISGPDNDDNNGWVYIKKYFPQAVGLSIDFQWASVDEGLGVDRPIYCIDETEPMGMPSNTNAQVEATPQQGIWNIVVPAGNWFSVGIYSNDSCCGKGFLSVDVYEVPPTVLTYNVGQPVSMTYPAVSMYCDGNQVSYQYSSEYGPFESTAAIVQALNASEGTSSTGVYVDLGDGNIQLTVPGDQVLNLCGPDGTLSFTVQPD